MKSIKYFLQFLIIFIFFIVFKLLGLNFASYISGKIISCVGPFFRSKKIIESNILKSLPNSNRNEIRKKSKMNDFGMNFWNSLHLDSFANFNLFQKRQIVFQFDLHRHHRNCLNLHVESPKTKFLNFERRKIWILDEILVKKHDFGLNFVILATKFWKSGSENPFRNLKSGSENPSSNFEIGTWKPLTLNPKIQKSTPENPKIETLNFKIGVSKP